MKKAFCSQIDFTIVDSGTPPSNSTATTRLNIQPVNDIPPELTIESSGGCVVDSSSTGPVHQLFADLAGGSRSRRGAGSTVFGPKLQVGE